MPSDRREFLQQLAVFAAALAANRCKPAGDGAGAPDAGTEKHPEKAQPQDAGALTPAQREALAACCERVLPTDQDPGARDTGVIAFADRELRRPELSEIRKKLAGGLLALERRAQRKGGKRFVELPPDEQDQLLAETQRQSLQGEQFLRILISLTLEGFLADPAYGGNRDRLGWKFIGYAPCAIEEGTVARSATTPQADGGTPSPGGHHHE